MYLFIFLFIYYVACHTLALIQHKGPRCANMLAARLGDAAPPPSPSGISEQKRLHHPFCFHGASPKMSQNVLWHLQTSLDFF